MYRTIDTATWDDPWFAELEPDAKLLFLYFITNRRTTACGAFEITERAMTFETGLDGTRLRAALKAISSKVGWWPKHQTVWVVNFYRHQRANSNERFTVSASRALAGFAPEVVKSVCDTYPELSNKETVPQVSHPNPITMPLESDGYKETVTEQNRTNNVSAAEPQEQTGEVRSQPKTKPALTSQAAVTAFAEFWAAYPRRDGVRVGRKNAEAEFAKLGPEDWPAVIKATTRYAKVCDPNRPNPRPPKDAERFLRDRIWQDMGEIEVVPNERATNGAAPSAPYRNLSELLANDPPRTAQSRAGPPPAAS